ncbi:MAG: amino acid permease [Gammaproteobacteria bacterium]|nr:amino acid permease [Gammaproteobacteria bacterium]
MIHTQKRILGFWRCWALVVGGAIGSAIFMMPALLVTYGGLGLISWAAAAVGALFIAMMLGNLSRRVTNAGGPYAYARAGFGDFAGFLIAWGFWIALWTACVAITIAFTGYLGALIPAIAASPLLTIIAGLALIWLFVGVNIAGVRESGIVGLVTTVLKLIPLVIIGTIGLLFVNTETLPPMNPGTANSAYLFASAFALTFWTFVGIEAVTVPAENVIDPDKTIPRALIIGTLTIAVVYLLVAFAVMGMIPADQLMASSAPLADAGVRIAGRWGGTVVSVGALVSMIGAFNITLLAAGQTAMAAARDGVFPLIFQRMTKRDTPGASFVIIGILASMMLVMNQTKGLVGAYTFILLISTLTVVIPYAFSAMAGLLLGIHDDKISAARKKREAFVSIVAFAICMWVIASSGEEAVYWTFLLLMAGVPVYVIVTRNARLSARMTK